MQSEMAVMGREGDTKITWDAANRDEVEMARDQFNAYTKRGFTAFRTQGPDGGQGEQMKTFDPKAERIIFVPRLVGG
jgi:hypothetical protein